MIPALIIWLALALPQDSYAVEIAGNVVAITDGDTITVLDTGKQQHKIRLSMSGKSWPGATTLEGEKQGKRQ